MAGDLSSDLEAARRLLQGVCAGLDPDSVPLPEVVGLFDTLAAVERLAAGAQLRLLRRVGEAHLELGPGVRSAEEEIARRTGTSVREAQESMAASKRLPDQAGTDAALRAGRLSGEQARTISDAAGGDRGAEADLLATAARADRGLRDLKAKAAETKARRLPDAAARREAIRRSRYCRTWTGVDGAWNLAMRHLPEVGAEIEGLLAPYTQAAFDAARKAGVHEAPEAYRADGMAAMAKASAQPGSSRPKGASVAETKVFVHIDLETLLAGRLAEGESSVCRIDGIGPVDVAWVRSILGDAFVVALLEDREGVRDVVHLGRKVTAHQRSALEARGYRCEATGCSATHGLQIDHVTGWALTRTTELDDLMWLCRHHHDQKTHRGARVTGPPGDRTWHPPPSRGSPRPSEPEPSAHRRRAPQPDLFAGSQA